MTFSGDGMETVSFGTWAWAHEVAVQGDGKLVIACAGDGAATDFAVARLNTNGSPDLTFGGDGKLMIDFAGFGEEAYGMVLQSDGKIVLTGGTLSPTFWDFGLARVLP